MIRALWTAATGMEAQQLNIDVISNNLANVNTAGFKKSRVDFQDLMYQTVKQAGTTEGQGSTIPTGVQIGLGAKPGSTSKIFTPGEMLQTDDPLSMRIDGDGFFQVQLPNGGSAYTRDGSFKRDSTGVLVTSDGYALDPQIQIPQDATDIAIGSDGTVSVTIPGQPVQEVGKIQLAKFANPAGLSNMGKNLLLATKASGDATMDDPGNGGLGSISNNQIEMSNVKVVEEMVNMILAQRAYEVNSKAIQTADEMLSIANNIRR